MGINVLLFGKVADKAGLRQVTLDRPATGLSLTTVRSEVLGQLFETGVLDQSAVQMSVNQVRVTGDADLSDGDEVAFFSAFSGG